MNKQLVEEAIAYISDLFKDNSDGHDLDHSLRVYRNAMKIAEKENGQISMVASDTAIHVKDALRNIIS